MDMADDGPPLKRPKVQFCGNYSSGSTNGTSVTQSDVNLLATGEILSKNICLRFCVYRLTVSDCLFYLLLRNLSTVIVAFCCISYLILSCIFSVLSSQNFIFRFMDVLQFCQR